MSSTMMTFCMTDETTGIKYYIQAESMVKAVKFLPDAVDRENVTVTSEITENPLNMEGITFIEREEVTSPWLTLFKGS